MCPSRRNLLSFLALVTLCFAAWASADEPTPGRANVTPKPLDEKTQKGIDYLISQQHDDGGWGQGGGWRTGEKGRVEGVEVKDPPDLGNTCIAALVLIRAGNTETQGPYAANLARAVDFICHHVESADKDSLWVTDIRDTQLQSKIGRYADTFLAGLVLSELKGKLQDSPLARRADADLEKVIAKIERNQQHDGTFVGNAGWASVLSQCLCSKALNRAFQNGVVVKQESLDRDFKIAFNTAKPLAGESVYTGGTTIALSGGTLLGGAAGGIGGSASISSAGVDLYAFSAGNAVASENIKSNAGIAKQAQAVLNNPEAKDGEKEKARQELKRVDEMASVQKAALAGIVDRLGDKKFIDGFGNNGGEEFLSYMNISETLLAQGGKEWEKWDAQMSENLHRVQNSDGSWSGHHCITGRTFCTSTALLALMADRSPAPLADAIQEKKASEPTR
ncbi:MAG TPA: prenyltransferase/squalene oxidase repeat-containing protein [Pirellulales bacterium]|nr:prenyltransferase/squalene oxidase repeat-containing protein [Pirellulales bacterium]